MKIANQSQLLITLPLLIGLVALLVLGMQYIQLNNALLQQISEQKEPNTEALITSEAPNTVIENAQPKLLQYNQEKLKSIQYWAILLLMGALVWLVVINYWLRRYVTKPLEQLAHLTSNENNIQVMTNIKPQKSSKEIQLLANNFNSLHQRLTNETKDTLQSKVAEQTAKERLRALVNNISLSIITINTDGRIDDFNPSTVALFNLSMSQLGGMDIGKILPNLNIQGGLFKQILNAGIDIELDAVVGNKLKPVELSCAEFNYTQSNLPIRQYILMLHDIGQRKRNEDRLKKLNQRLINTSRQAGMAEIATSILHNVGNVLNSVNTSVSVLQLKLTQSNIVRLQKIAQMFKQEGVGLFQENGKGPQLILYLEAVTEQLMEDAAVKQDEVTSLKQSVNHIAQIVSAQQKTSGKSGLIEHLSINEIIEEAININLVSLENNQVLIERDYTIPIEIMGDRAKIVQILVNLIRNANEAMMHPSIQATQMTQAKIIIGAQIVDQQIMITIKDNGLGITPQNMKKMFSYGFTTKQNGHGFGLHSCALAAKEMDGDLTVHSDGENKGALFSLKIPVDPTSFDSHNIETLIKESKQ